MVRLYSNLEWMHYMANVFAQAQAAVTYTNAELCLICAFIMRLSLKHPTPPFTIASKHHFLIG